MSAALRLFVLASIVVLPVGWSPGPASAGGPSAAFGRGRLLAPDFRPLGFTPDGTALVCAGHNKLSFWEFKDGYREKSSVQLPMTFADSILFAADGKAVLVAGLLLKEGSQEAKVVVQWIDPSGKEKYKVLLEIPRVSDRTKTALSADRKWLAVASNEERKATAIQLWDLSTKPPQQVDPLKLAGHAGFLAFSPDGKYLVSNNVRGEDGLVAVWEVATGELTAEWKAEGDAVSSSFSADGKLLAVSDMYGGVRVWDFTTRKERLAVNVGKEPERPDFDDWSGAAFSPNGRFLATGGKALILWDAATGKELDRRDIATGEENRFKRARDLLFSPDGGQLFFSAGTGEEGLRVVPLAARPKK